jgi:hypothetical protein
MIFFFNCFLGPSSSSNSPTLQKSFFLRQLETLNLLLENAEKEEQAQYESENESEEGDINQEKIQREMIMKRIRKSVRDTEILSQLEENGDNSLSLSPSLQSSSVSSFPFNSDSSVFVSSIPSINSLNRKSGENDIIRNSSPTKFFFRFYLKRNITFSIKIFWNFSFFISSSKFYVISAQFFNVI